ncbi:MAG: WecB/TagA/CpsF family glycosyltransferase [Spirochaetes bacterium]|nr:WecB/TagA/CpsF family glycosyltransferase [Spirochaetota bacterium]
MDLKTPKNILFEEKIKEKSNYFIKNYLSDYEFIEFKGIKIYNLDSNNIISLIKNTIKENIKLHIITLNAIILTKALLNKKYMQLLSNSDLIIAESDGIGLLFKMFDKKLKEKVAGIDLARKLLHFSEVENHSVFLLGGSKEVSLLSEKNIKATFKNLKVVGRFHGYFKDETEEKNIVTIIRKSSPDILFVAMGFPKQDIFINKYKESLNSKVMIGIGGTFDIFAGKKRRAPKFFIKNKLEWFYRIITNPLKYYQFFLILIFFFICIFIGLKNFILKTKNRSKENNFKREKND